MNSIKTLGPLTVLASLFGIGYLYMLFSIFLGALGGLGG
jgi:hypothetical protein